jgi:PAS domain S-box-containing protein
MIDRATGKEEDFFRKAFLMNPTTILVYTLDEGRIIEANEGVLRNFGLSRDEVMGKTFLETGIVRDQDWQLLDKAIHQQGLYNNIEIPLYTGEGEALVCLLCGHRVNLEEKDCVILTVNNITVRRWMEEELLRSKNLGTIAILAGGIARDFNNLLSAIMGNISMAKLALDDVEKIHRTLSRAEELSVEAAELAGKLLTFSDGGAPVVKEISIPAIINNLVKSESKAPGADMEILHTTGTWTVQGDEVQLGGLFLNLIRNALEAIPKGRRGKIVLETRNLVVPWDNPMALREGRYVKVSVRDNGIGIAPKDLDNVFAPYYTTKDTVTGGGVGLGLSICQSIVKRHNGYIGVESTPGEGTVMTVFIPAFDENEPIVREDGYSYLKGSGRILVMDDEQFIGDITDKMLKQIGYEVDIAKEGHAAFVIYREAMAANKPYDAVILNLSNKVGAGGEEALAAAGI